MIVDDSAFVRQTLAGILNLDPEIQVVALAADPIFAATKISREMPDVITLDLEMPRMNGLTFLKKLMSQFPIPVVIISSLSEKSNELAFKALQLGAVEVITKPRLITREFFEESRMILCDAVKAAAQADLKKTIRKSTANEIIPKMSADEILELSLTGINLKNTTEKLIGVGASTGGTNAVEEFLCEMPPDCPGIVIVQHMPEHFTRSFAERLNKICRITVKEGTDKEMITPGKALIAPGNRHMMVKRTGARYSVEISDGPLVNRHRPSVDVLFRSIANVAGPNAVGILMTGMGDDGARGLLEMKYAGGHTIAQDEESCVVFGMPKVAIAMDAASVVMPLSKMARYSYQRLNCRS